MTSSGQDPDPDQAGRAVFGPTRWSLVIEAQGTSPEARIALAELCEAYYEPVFRFLRREGRDEDAARELAQEFFSRVLGRGGFGTPDPARGRFRSYLLGAVKHFLSDQRKQAGREKRGSTHLHESMDSVGTDDVESGLQVPDPRAGVADTHFDRDWALAVMRRSLDRLEEEFREGGKREQFEVLQPWLVGDAAGLSQTEAGRRLGLGESAVKVAVHRLRRRFRDVVRSELLQTLPTGDDPDQELRYLAEVLGGIAEGG